MKSAKILRNKYILWAIPLVVVLFLAVAIIMINIPQNHDADRDSLWSGYSHVALPSSLTLTDSKWRNDSKILDGTPDFWWEYTYKPSLNRADEYRELKASFDAQGFEEPKGFDNLAESTLWAGDPKHKIQISAVFMPQPADPTNLSTAEPLQSVEIDVRPYSTPKQ